MIVTHSNQITKGIPARMFYDLVGTQDQRKIREFISKETDITKMFLGYYVPKGTRGFEIAVYFYREDDLTYWLLRVG